MNVTPNIITIPDAQQAVEKRQHKQVRVAVYCRISAAAEEQKNIYRIMVEYYTNYIMSNPNWTLVGIFTDKGIVDTQAKNKAEFNRMMQMCKNRKIDLILCKTISRFAGNTIDCLENVRLLKSLGIGVIFEKENINTLSAQGEFILSLYGSLSQAKNKFICDW